MAFACVAILLSGCNSGNQNKKRNQANQPEGGEQSSHERMLAELEKISNNLDDNKYFGEKEYRDLISMSKGNLNGIQSVAVPAKLGHVCMKLGKEQEAIDQLRLAYNRLKAFRGQISRQQKETMQRSLEFQLGLAHLRLAETQNCCQRNTPDSCVVPIEGGGIHTRQESSRKAIEYFLMVVRSSKPGSPDHLKAKWLLNISCMTIGAYPNLLDQKDRIPESFFKSTRPFPRLLNRSKELGIDTFGCAGGAIVDDFDNDLDLDLIVSDNDPKGQLRYFRNDREKGFVDATESANLIGIFGGLNINQADYNNDGFVDVFVMRGGWFEDKGRHPNSLLKNNGDGTFTDVTFEAGLAEKNFPTQTSGWADYDLDGDLDLLIGNERCGVHSPTQLFRNNGDGTFTDVAREAKVDKETWTKAVAWGDFNNDRYPDFYVSSLDHRNRLFKNNGDGTFTDVAETMGVTEPLASFPTWFWDFDNDGKLDLFVASYSSTVVDFAAFSIDGKAPKSAAKLYRNIGDKFVDVGTSNGISMPSAPMGSNFGDLNNDGYLDAYIGTGWPQYEELMPNLLFINEQGKRFANVTMNSRLGHLQKGHAVAFADLDHDGDNDIFQQMGGAFPGDRFFDAYFENPGFDNRWIALKLVGADSNRSAIGARIKLTIEEDGSERMIHRRVNSGGSFGSNPLRELIGLGKASTIKRLEVYWPKTDTWQLFDGVEAGQFLRIVEGEKAPEKLSYEPIQFGTK